MQRKMKFETFESKIVIANIDRLRSQNGQKETKFHGSEPPSDNGLKVDGWYYIFNIYSNPAKVTHFYKTALRLHS